MTRFRAVVMRRLLPSQDTRFSRREIVTKTCELIAGKGFTRCVYMVTLCGDTGASEPHPHWGRASHLGSPRGDEESPRLRHRRLGMTDNEHQLEVSRSLAAARGREPWCEPVSSPEPPSPT